MNKRAATVLWLSILAALPSLAMVSPAASGASLVPGSEWPALLLGDWHGKWSSDFYERRGELELTIATSDGKKISGAGASNGGLCTEPFQVLGQYNAKELRLRFEFKEEECGDVGYSGIMGRDDNGDLVVVGHWHQIIEGKASGKYFGILVLSKSE